MSQAAGGPGAQQVWAQHGMAELGSGERLLNLGRRCEGPTPGAWFRAEEKGDRAESLLAQALSVMQTPIKTYM